MEETIAAICTPPGNGGIAVIRISGENAFLIANQIFTGYMPSYVSHTAHLGKVHSSSGEVIDEVFLLVMHKEKSYTGKPTVEDYVPWGMHVKHSALCLVNALFSISNLNIIKK